VLAALADPDESVRSAAAEAVLELGPAAGRAAPGLEKLLTSKHEFVRDQANRALTEVRKPLADVIRALEQGEPKVRRRVVFKLGLMGPAARDALPALKAVAAAESDASLRAAAEAAIHRIEAK